MPNPKALTLASLAACALFLATSCASKSQTSQEQPSGQSPSSTNGSVSNADHAPASRPKAATIQFATDKSDMGGEVYIAIDQGYFDQQGLTVTPHIFAQGVDGIDAVLGGQADLAAATTTAAVTRLKSGHLTILGSIALSPPGWHKLAVRTNITSPEQLAGKRIGYAAGTAEQYVTVQYLKKLGLTTDDVDMKPFTALFDMVTALRSGKIDAAWIWGDGVDQVKDDKNIKIWFDDSVVSKGTNYYIVSTTDYAKKNTDILARFFTALDKATAFMHTNPDHAAQIEADATKGDANTFKGYLKETKYSLGFGQDDYDNLKSFIEWADESGFAEVPKAVDTYLNLDAIRTVVPNSVIDK